jgi:Protein of unknown function (DUF3326)
MSGLNGVFIIPTGLGCALGGDAAFNPGVKLIASCADTLIVNPNAVNASDINELPPNCLYVEGSVIDRFLAGELNLRRTRTFNRILMVVNPPVLPLNINSMNAGIWGLGANVEILPLKVPLKMCAEFNSDGTAGGTYSGVDELIDQVKDLDFDALAIQTPIECDQAAAHWYWENGGINPWGGIEAIVSKAVARGIGKPVAHAPSDSSDHTLHSEIVVGLSMAPEIISNTYTFCILKGLHRAPRIEFDLLAPGSVTRDDVDFLVSPHGCWGPPHEACSAAGIPILVVQENTTCFSEGFVYPPGGVLMVRNYLEAAGMILAMSSGIDPRTVLVK